MHPVNVQSVAWIAERKNNLAMVFFLLSILWYLREIELQRTTDRHQRTSRWYWLSLLAFVLAMLSKGSVAFLPVVLLLIEWWQRRRISLWNLARTAPLFLVAALLTGVNIWFQTHASGEVFRVADFGQRLAGAGTIVWFYLSKVLLPINLAFVYPQWDIQTSNWRWWLPLLAALIVTGVLARQTNSPKANWVRPLMFAWGYFCLALVPVLGFIGIGFMQYSVVADHYQHTALIGVVALVAAGCGTWYHRARGAIRSMAVGTAVILTGTLTFLAWQNSQIYGSPVALYQATMLKNPNCWMVYNNLGMLLNKLGRTQASIELFEKALRLEPNSAKAHNNLGIALAQSGQFREAIAQYQEAIKLNRKFPDAYLSLGNALFSTNRPQQAVEPYEMAVRLKPNYAEAHHNLGVALAKLGRTQQAIEQFQEAVRLLPTSVKSYVSLAAVYAQLHRDSEAIAMAQKGLDMARSTGQTAFAQHIEVWLTRNRLQEGKVQDASSASETSHPSP